jgi:hypothetical protein
MIAYLRRFRHFMRLVGPSLASAHAFCWLTGWHPVRSVRVGGFPVVVRLGTSDLKVAIAGFIGREYEPITLARARVIVDAGANIGTSAVFFARKWPGARILALEPEAGNFALLLRNVSECPNVVPIRAAPAKNWASKLRPRSTMDSSAWPPGWASPLNLPQLETIDAFPHSHRETDTGRSRGRCRARRDPLRLGHARTASRRL